MLICPTCRKELSRGEKTFVCGNGHSFDIARQGYVNLLMSQKSGNHGDSREMLEARKGFLDGGGYSFLREKLSEVVISLLGEKENPAILDSGCGECYYTEEIFGKLTDLGKAPTVCAIDISKDALRLASGRFHGNCRGKDAKVSLAVASAYSLPVGDGSADAVISVFAPLCASEFRRVLSENGVFVTVIPDEKHLWELKKAIYDEPYGNEPFSYGLDGFTLISETKISSVVHLPDKKAISDLFTMTPYFCRTSRSDREKLEGIESLDTRAEFIILAYRVNK